MDRGRTKKMRNKVRIGLVELACIVAMIALMAVMCLSA